MKESFLKCLFAFALFSAFWLSGCDGSGDNSLRKKYSLYLMMKDGSEYLVQTDTIMSGEMLNPEKSGTKVIPPRIFYDLIVRENNYYRLNWKDTRFVRNTIENQEFKETGSIQLPGQWSVDTYAWQGDTLCIFGYDTKKGVARFAKITLDNLKAQQSVVSLPKPVAPFNSMSIGFANFMNGNLYLGYTYHKTDLKSYTTSDTLYVSQLSYPDMKVVRTFKDTRSTYPGGVNTRQSHFFNDEKGDFYFIACPGIALGDNRFKPTGIFRINKLTGELDKDYFFNLSASQIQNHGYGFWYLGNGKAIVRTERKGVFKGMEDHWLVPHFDFYVIDLEKQTTTRLNLPLDKGTARNCVLVENGLAYITVNPNKGGNYVWIYNPETGALKKGLHFSDEVDYILRLETLNP
ncbi:DUF4374 domain-containing protein [Dyadobacter chenhuakuii]|uniref:DUF4374 domain-containing protein n=1 Tax=Dyadobacter chenhuakuii TaxID=2909339 RepID=A0A9X1TSE0_9BACT|nr:DUF4374 domain-containing protein [Dyadobacter chenhuakuii]MCF2498984.1 DUF4374 domain-containing protein [Dyadobacter chenhuakuii]